MAQRGTAQGDDLVFFFSILHGPRRHSGVGVQKGLRLGGIKWVSGNHRHAGAILLR